MQRRDMLKLGLGSMAALAAGWTGRAWSGGPAQAGAPLSTGALDAAAWTAARRWTQTPFGRIAHVERGAGPAALFLHGFPLNGFQWRGALERLSAHRRCIAPDMLGLGYTEVAEGQGVTPADQVRMLADLLDRLGVDSVDLVANDSGGAVAQLFAVAHPRRVRSLLLTNCDAETDCPPPALKPVIDLAREGRFATEWLAPWLADHALARSPQGLGGMTFTHPHNPTDEAIEMYLRPLVDNAARTHAYALGLDSNVLAGVEAALKQGGYPTRILWGTGDDIFSKDSPDYLAGVFGESRGVRRLDGAKLFWPEEFPDLVAEEARRLWGV